MRGYSIAEVLGSIAKWAAIVVVFGFSITLSYMFFLSITPHDKPWFTFTGLGLTEGGFVLWMAVFMLTRHDPVHKAIALVMSCACAFTSVAIAGYQFYSLLSSEFALAHNAAVIQIISILLEIMFGAHITAFIIDMFASYFARPGHAFRATGRAVMIEGSLAQTGSVQVVESDEHSGALPDASQASLDTSTNSDSAPQISLQKVVKLLPQVSKRVTLKDRELALESLVTTHPDLTVKQLSQQLGIGESTIRQWKKERQQ